MARSAQVNMPAHRAEVVLAHCVSGAYRLAGGVPFTGALTIHWSRRGGRPAYAGRNPALAAPRLSSSVRHTCTLRGRLLLPSIGCTRARLRSRTVTNTRLAARVLSYSAHARRGSATIASPSPGKPRLARKGGAPARLARQCSDGRPLRWPTRAGPNMRSCPPAHARRHTPFRAPKHLTHRASVRVLLGASPDSPHYSRHRPIRGPTRSLPDGPSAAYTGV
jgi:hypothetical protein